MSQVTSQVVPDGYKQTEVGVIPDDWTVSTLNSLTMKKRPISYGIVQTGRKINGGIPCLRVLDIVDGKINSENLIFTTQRISDSYKRTQLIENDLVMPLRGKVGEVGLISKELVGANLTRGVALIALEKEYVPQYVKQALCSESAKNRLLNSMNGSALQEISIGTLRSFKLVIPQSSKEQTAIATALSDVDVLLSELEKLIAKKQAIKTATMQQLLTGKTRLPAFVKYKNGKSSNHFEGNNLQNQAGIAPEGWGRVTLGHDATLKARIGWQALTTKEYLEFGPRLLVTGTDFNAGIVDWNSCCYVSEWRYKQDFNIQLREGDVLVTKDGTIGKVGYVSKLPLEATLNSGVFVIRPKNKKFVPKFLFYVLNSSIFTDFIRAITAGSTITHLYQRDFVNFGFYAPTEEEQTAIATILSNMDEEIQALKQRLSKTRQIKQGMMQELLTGKTRLIQGEADD
ncbi:restriction endonuclease subunit S [Vibrio splendidus]|uniref:Restriction endonuclease subunit S n=1 Tax=Vibrio splendidus TaxID=29497 RepID=A0A2T5E026_VIBSP|nr:restriction endonuclease subunit S [Vibrio splendidus]OEE62293.1 hypothetical protein A147_03340 [Vibrio splendidus FF-6]PTP12680.1 restriction endonuclease subunit S [Vibrio splendidus]